MPFDFFGGAEESVNYERTFLRELSHRSLTDEEKRLRRPRGGFQ